MFERVVKHPDWFPSDIVALSDHYHRMNTVESQEKATNSKRFHTYEGLGGATPPVTVTTLNRDFALALETARTKYPAFDAIVYAMYNHSDDTQALATYLKAINERNV